MSESEAHRHLVRHAAITLQRRFPHGRTVADAQGRPGDPLPPLVGGFRPDVWTKDLMGRTLAIGEAKSLPKDFEKDRTYNQAVAFIRQLERFQDGLFVLFVYGEAADQARTFLRVLTLRERFAKTTLCVHDTLDLWHLRHAGSMTWRLG